MTPVANLTTPHERPKHPNTANDSPMYQARRKRRSERQRSRNTVALLVAGYTPRPPREVPYA